MEFSKYTPFYHTNLDKPGLAAGTRVWEAGGGFVAVERLKAGDVVFGITFGVEEDYLPINDNPADPSSNIVQVWRPRLVGRKVLDIKVHKARAWQVTFGDHSKEEETRRLVAGADTRMVLFPLCHDDLVSKRIVDMKTSHSETNPRTGHYVSNASYLDMEKSAELGYNVWVKTPYSGAPAGEYATIIPYEMYGGQLEMLTTSREYNRYLYKQVREVIPLVAETTLYELVLQSDTRPEFGITEKVPTRCNVICQTPFAPQSKTRRIAVDALSTEVNGIKSAEQLDQFEAKWDKWAQENSPKPITQPSQIKTVETKQTFYETQSDEKLAKGLKDRFGITDGFLDGGILIDMTSYE